MSGAVLLMLISDGRGIALWSMEFALLRRNRVFAASEGDLRSMWMDGASHHRRDCRSAINTAQRVARTLSCASQYARRSDGCNAQTIEKIVSSPIPIVTLVAP